MLSRFLLQDWKQEEVFRHVGNSIFDLEFCPSSAAEGKTRMHFSLSFTAHGKFCLSHPSIIIQLYLYIQHSRCQHLLALADS